MRPYYEDASVVLHHGDCLDVLRSLPDSSVDAVVTDPPYGLANTDPAHVAETITRWVNGERDYLPGGAGFMGKAWDSFVPPVAVWDECLRVLKPGGHVLAFAGSRTMDLMTLGLRLAGFDIRDSVAWLYGSGFPKSLDVSKAIDKAAPREGMFDAFAAHFREQREASGLTQKAVAQHFPSKTGGLTGCVWNWENGANVPTRAQWAILAPMLDLSDEWLPLIERVEAERAVIGQRMTGIGTGRGAVAYIADSDNRDITAPATPDAERWQGWGTALKPAFEPVVVARKPLSGTVAANVLAHGTGALNIAGCRIGLDGEKPPTGSGVSMQATSTVTPYRTGDGPNVTPPAGRWPANVVLDESQAAALDAMSGESVSKSGGRTTNALGVMNDDGWQAKDLPRTGHEDQGGASRFFYVAREDDPRWSGPICAMCNGTGGDFAYSGEPMQPVRRDVPTGLRCRACNGHGREASDPLPLDELGSRFTYVAKADASERVRVDGIAHPTVKPLALMRWLVRLVTPPGGTVLEPFAGSGTTVEACILEGFRCVAIEREADYLPLIVQRINRRRDPVAAVKASGDDGGLFDLIEDAS